MPGPMSPKGGAGAHMSLLYWNGRGLAEVPRSTSREAGWCVQARWCMRLCAVVREERTAD
jgi:hypothetical protein